MLFHLPSQIRIRTYDLKVKVDANDPMLCECSESKSM